MRAGKFTFDQIIRILAEAELPTASISSTARRYCISQNTLRSSRERILDAEVFESIVAAKQKIINWINDYNTQRPHTALEYKAPLDVWYLYKTNNG